MGRGKPPLPIIFSPGTKHDDIDACCVIPEGIVFDTVNIGVSYGRISPVTTISEFTQIVYPNGILNNGSYGVENSYGNSLSGHGLG